MHVSEESLGSSQCNNDIFLKAFKLFWLLWEILSYMQGET